MFYLRLRPLAFAYSFFWSSEVAYRCNRNRPAHMTLTAQSTQPADTQPRTFTKQTLSSHHLNDGIYLCQSLAVCSCGVLDHLFRSK